MQIIIGDRNEKDKSIGTKIVSKIKPMAEINNIVPMIRK